MKKVPSSSSVGRASVPANSENLSMRYYFDLAY